MKYFDKLDAMISQIKIYFNNITRNVIVFVNEY